MTCWPSKDPDAVLDYAYDIPLDEGDAVQSYQLEKLSGDVVIDQDTRTSNRVTAILSGGTDGQTSVFRISWITTGGRENDAVLSLLVAANTVLTPLTGYTPPTAAHLKAAFPKFASVSDQTADFWLDRAARSVDQGWSEGDFAMGQMLMACHLMTLEGLGEGAEAELAKAGLSGMQTVRSGKLSFTKAPGNTSAAAGSIESTSYGVRFMELLKQNRSGARVTPTGQIPDYPLYNDGYYYGNSG